jgi:hypothetical protein
MIKGSRSPHGADGAAVLGYTHLTPSGVKAIDVSNQKNEKSMV